MSDKSAISQRAVAKLTAGADIRAIVPTTIEETFRLAELVHQSGLAPYQLKTPAALTVVFLKGLEIGSPPMAAMETIGVINGKACLHSDGIPMLLWSHGFKIEEWYENEDTLDKCVAHCKITRPRGDVFTFKFSAQDAKDNRLWDTREKTGDGKPNKSPWFLYQKRMLRMRCRGWLARDCASDALKGMPIYEEQEDIERQRGEHARDVTPRGQQALEVPNDIPDETEGTVAGTVSEAEDNQDGLLTNPQKHVEELEAQLRMAKTEEDFDEAWAAHEELVEAGRLPRAYQEEAEAIKEKHGKRFETKA